jgi:hypothetical protein
MPTDNQILDAVEAYDTELAAWTLEPAGTEQWVLHDLKRERSIDANPKDCTYRREFYPDKDRAKFQARCEAMKKALEAVLDPSPKSSLSPDLK